MATLTVVAETTDQRANPHGTASAGVTTGNSLKKLGQYKLQRYSVSGNDGDTFDFGVPIQQVAWVGGSISYEAVVTLSNVSTIRLGCAGVGSVQGWVFIWV